MEHVWGICMWDNRWGSVYWKQAGRVCEISENGTRFCKQMDDNPHGTCMGEIWEVSQMYENMC